MLGKKAGTCNMSANSEIKGMDRTGLKTSIPAFGRNINIGV